MADPPIGGWPIWNRQRAYRDHRRGPRVAPPSMQIVARDGATLPARRRSPEWGMTILKIALF